MNENTQHWLKQLGNRARLRRLEIGVTLAELARQLNVTAANLRNWEKALPLKTRACENSWEELLQVAPGWLRTAEMAASEPEPLTLDLTTRSLLAARLRERRNELGLSVLALSKASSVGYQKLLQWERSFPRERSAVPCERLEAVLQVPNRWLLDRTMSAVRQEHIVLRAHSVSEEIVLLSEWICASRAHRAIGGPLSATQQRNADIFATYRGVRGGHLTTLQATADRFDITRERVRQIIEKMMGRLVGQRFLLPSLNALLESVSACLPEREDILTRKFQHLLGAQLTVGDACVFAREVLGLPSPVVTDTPGGFQVGVRCVVPTGFDASLLREIRSVALWMIRSVGAAQIYVVAGKIAETTRKPVDYSIVLKQAQMNDSFEWLDEPNGWFWLGPERDSRVVNTVRKMLTVSERPIDVDEISYALSRTRPERVGFLMDAPASVLCNLVSKLPHVRTVQFNNFIFDETVDRSLRRVVTLSETEQSIERGLVAAGGVAARRVLKKCAHADGVEEGTFTMALETTPIVRPVIRGVYALVGHEFSADDFEAAVAKADLSRVPLLKSDKKIGYEFMITESIHKSSLYSPPARIGRHIVSGPYALDGTDLAITYTDDGRFNGFTRALRVLGLLVGETCRLWINVQTKSISLERCAGIDQDAGP